MEIQNLYNKIRHNKALTAGIVGFTAGTAIMFSPLFFRYQPQIPNDVAKYNDITTKIERIYNQPMIAKDFLNPAFRDSLEKTLAELGAERDSLKSLPNFEYERSAYEHNITYAKGNEKKADSLITMGLIIGLISAIPLGSGYAKIQRRNRLKKKN